MKHRGQSKVGTWGPCPPEPHVLVMEASGARMTLSSFPQISIWGQALLGGKTERPVWAPCFVKIRHGSGRDVDVNAN